MGMLESLLSTDLNDVADLPTYSVPPVGTYRLKIKKIEEKEVDLSKGGKAPVIQFDYVALEPLELVDETKRGDFKPDMEFGESYFFHNDPAKTLSAMKATFGEVLSAMNWTNVLELVKGGAGLEIVATVMQRKDKNDPDKVYAKVVNAHLV